MNNKAMNKGKYGVNAKQFASLMVEPNQSQNGQNLDIDNGENSAPVGKKPQNNKLNQETLVASTQISIDILANDANPIIIPQTKNGQINLDGELIEGQILQQNNKSSNFAQMANFEIAPNNQNHSDVKTTSQNQLEQDQQGEFNATNGININAFNGLLDNIELPENFADLINKSQVANSENSAKNIAVAKSNFKHQLDNNALQGENNINTNNIQTPNIVESATPIVNLAINELPIKTDARAKDIIKDIADINFENIAIEKNNSDFDASQINATPSANQGDAITKINNLQELATMMVQKSQDGEKKFFVRLDPAELGKVEVEISFSNDNQISAVLSAETPQALNELMRSAKDLINSLNQNGLEVKQENLSFTLNNGQNNNAKEQNGQKPQKTNKANLIALEDVSQKSEQQTQTTIHHEIWNYSRISLRV